MTVVHYRTTNGLASSVPILKKTVSAVGVIAIVFHCEYDKTVVSESLAVTKDTMVV
jgi:hypothetical protein